MIDGVRPTAVRAWRPPVPGIREVLHARFGEHAYPPHTHDAWTLFIVDDGAIRYDLDRHERSAGSSMVSLLPPHVVHDGRPATVDGYRKRVIYLDPETIGEDLIGRSVDRSVVPDPGLRGRVAALHDRLVCADDMLEAETRLAFVVERIRAAYRPVGGAAPEPDPPADLADALRAYLDDHLAESVTMAAATEELGASPTRLTRAFIAAFGIAPHAYLLGRRFDAARLRLLDGVPLADVATDVGFFDQAHLTRHFKRFLGVTPGTFATAGSRRAE